MVPLNPLLVAFFIFTNVEYSKGLIVAKQKDFWDNEPTYKQRFSRTHGRKDNPLNPAKIIRNDEVICTGAILKRYWVVTISLCFNPNATYFVQLNANKKIEIQTVIKDPNYDPVNYLNNIAMVKLQAPIYEIESENEPVKVSAKGLKRIIHRCRMYGYIMSDTKTVRKSDWNPGNIVRNETLSRFIMTYTSDRVYTGALVNCGRSKFVIQGLLVAVVNKDGNLCPEMINSNGSKHYLECKNPEYLIARFPLRWMENTIIGTAWLLPFNNGSLTTHSPIIIIIILISLINRILLIL